jgi:hypothetical protein
MSKLFRFLSVMLALAFFFSAFAPAAVSAKQVASAPVSIRVSAANDFLNADALSLTTLPFKCQYLGQSPQDGALYGTTNDFDMIWHIKNVGTRKWEETEIDYGYKSGTHMEKYDPLYDLPRNVGVGKKMDIIVDMVTPSTPGTYWTLWTLRFGWKTFCSMTITVNVQ